MVADILNMSLYYVYIPSIDMYKLGITTNLEKRFNSNLIVTNIWDVELPTKEAIEFEHKVHTTFQKYRYSGSKKLLPCNGNNELYHTNLFKTYEELKQKLNEAIQ